MIRYGFQTRRCPKSLKIASMRPLQCFYTTRLEQTHLIAIILTDEIQFHLESRVFSLGSLRFLKLFQLDNLPAVRL